jgi:hypothetical protein
MTHQQLPSDVAHGEGAKSFWAAKSTAPSTVSTVPTSLELNVDVLVEIVGPPRFALNSHPALILLNISSLLCHPALVLFNERRKSDSAVIRDFNVR